MGEVVDIEKNVPHEVEIVQDIEEMDDSEGDN